MAISLRTNVFGIAILVLLTCTFVYYYCSSPPWRRSSINHQVTSSTASRKVLTPSWLQVVNEQLSSSTSIPRTQTHTVNVSTPSTFSQPQSTSPVQCPSDKTRKYTKNFVYLIQTESCIPKDLLSPSALGDPSACDCDVVVLGFKQPCTRNHSSHIKHIFHKSTWTTGREGLYNDTVKAGKTYMYYLFMDDDARPDVYRGDKSRNAWRTLERFLLRYRPPVALCDTESWHYVNTILKMRKSRGCELKDLEENVPAMYWDALFNIFHYEATKSVLEPIFPYWKKFDSSSWYYSNWYVCVMADVVYHLSNVYNSDVIARNPKHRPYPRSQWSQNIVTEIFTDVQSVIPKEFKEKGESILDQWRNCDLDLKRKNHYNYCQDPPGPCVQPFQYEKGA